MLESDKHDNSLQQAKPKERREHHLFAQDKREAGQREKRTRTNTSSLPGGREKYFFSLLLSLQENVSSTRLPLINSGGPPSARPCSTPFRRLPAQNSPSPFLAAGAASASPSASHGHRGSRALLRDREEGQRFELPRPPGFGGFRFCSFALVSARVSC